MKLAAKKSFAGGFILQYVRKLFLALFKSTGLSNLTKTYMTLLLGKAM